jgi:NADPH:quinone reductase-like Zn-dependent oxidoreductase
VNRYARWAIRTANRVTTRPTGLSTSLRHLVPGRAEEARLRDAIGGKTILVTGASSGIGEATARLAARRVRTSSSWRGGSRNSNG